MDIHGTCHCGNLALELDWPDGAMLPVRRCGCAFCRQHGAEWTSHPQAGLVVKVRSRQYLSRYRFGTKTADFLTCTQCGLVPAAISRIEGRDYAVVNVRTLDLSRATTATRQHADFSGEDQAARLERRRRNWIARVRVDLGGDP